MPVKRAPGDPQGPRDTVVDGVTVASGSSLAGRPVRMGGRALMMIFTPSGIAGSLLSFQAAGPSGSYLNVYDDNGSEVLVGYGAERAVGVDLTGALAAADDLKVRTGPVGSANAQTAPMTILFRFKG